MVIRVLACPMGATQPRRFVHPQDRDGFGKSLSLRWPAAPGSDALRAAAYRQHLLALNVRLSRKARSLSVAALASSLGVQAETLRRKLRGEQFMSAEDEAMLALFFHGASIIPPPEELLPPD